MIRLLMLGLSLILSLALSSAYATDPRSLTEATTVCETYLPHMRDAQAALKRGTRLTEGQDAVWRVWNTQCRHASWQHALAEGLPPVPVQPDFGTRLPPPSLTWRDYVYAGLVGLERGLTSPLYVCNSQTYLVKGQARSYGFCGPR